LDGTFVPLVKALAAFDDGSGPSIFAGGTFSAVDSGDIYLARWSGCLDSVPPVISCPPSVTSPDRLGSPQGKRVTFSVTATDDFDPAPRIECVPPSGSFFPVGTTTVTCTATDAKGNQSTCQFPVIVQIHSRPR